MSNFYDLTLTLSSDKIFHIRVYTGQILNAIKTEGAETWFEYENNGELKRYIQTVGISLNYEESALVFYHAKF